MSDHELLQEYADTGSPTAFRELVERHLALVYSAGRRRLADAHLAEDVAQQVFVLLARKAGQLVGRVILSGWLYRAACHVASETLRRETRRQQREQQAAHAMNLNEPDAAWREIEPLLDDAMARLGPGDRDAVVLRYFENKSLREVGAALGVSDDAAQKRLRRAIERLREQFARHRKPLTGAVLTAAIAGGALQSVPVGLAASVATGALSGAALLTTTATLTAAMSWTTLKPILTGAAALAAGAALVVQSTQLTGQRRANESLLERAEAAEQAARTAAEAQRAALLAAESDPRNTEIARLRAEVAELRRILAEQAGVAAENARLREALEEVAQAVEQREEAAEAEDPERAALKTVGIAKLNYAKRWGLAFILFAEAHGGRMPASLAEAAPYFGKPSAGELDGAVWDERTLGLLVPTPGPGATNLTALNPDQFEITYHGRLDEIQNPMNAILLREKEPFQAGSRGLSRTYLFADGHSEIHLAPDGDFATWEAERLATGPRP